MSWLQSLRIHEGTYTVDTEKQIIEIHYDKVTSHPDGEELENYLLIEPLAVIELNDDKFVANFLNFFTVECSPVRR